MKEVLNFKVSLLNGFVFVFWEILPHSDIIKIFFFTFRDSIPIEQTNHSLWYDPEQLPLCHSVFLICKEQWYLPYISLCDDKCIITCKGVSQCLVRSKHLASVRWLIIITTLNLSFIFKSLVHQEFLCDTNFHICKD